MKKAIKGILVVLGACCFFGFGSMDVFDRGIDKTPAINLVNRRNADIWNKHAIDSVVATLQSGNIVLRMGLGADSHLLAQINRKDKSYSHCGIVMVEDGYPFVYHSIGGEDNPDERLRRDSANFFFSPDHNIRLAVIQYDYSAEKVQELRQVVGAFYHSRPRFDMQFDLKTDDKLYCSEFVYKAITRTMNDTAYISTTSVLGHNIVGIDDLFMNKHASIACQLKFE